MLHKEVREISYRHHYKIKQVFKEIMGLHGVEHFSLDLVRPDEEMVFFSGTPSHAFEICNQGYGDYDGIISPDYYKNFEFYWWKNAAHKAFAPKIEAIRQGVLGLKHGFMLVRQWNHFYLIYSFATKKQDLSFQTQVVNDINSFLKIGDWAYEEIKETYSKYTGDYEPPTIDRFYSFEGGKPPARYSRNYLPMKLSLQGKKESNKIICVDFMMKKKLEAPYDK